MFTELGHKLNEAERSGKPIPADLQNIDLGVQPVCTNCGRPIYDEPPLRCSGCKAVLYCGVECSKKAWKTCTLTPGQPSHKVLCADNKRHMEYIPQTESVLRSFPWGRLETDGTFNDELARGRFDVLGGTGTGFWSRRGGPLSHENHGDMSSEAVLANQGRGAAFDNVVAMFHHLDGHDLLHHKGHLTDQQGWKLSEKLIPFRNVSKIFTEHVPVLATEFEGGVTDWDSWHKWRKIPKDSPAALLLHYPLSVYQLIVHTLKLTSPSAGTTDKRVKLTVHLLGPEVELNFLPLFSEIAFLLPHHDIVLRLWGPAVHKLCEIAKKGGLTSSPLRKALAKKDPVFEYTAPRDLGSGKVSIFLHGDKKTWNVQDMRILLHEQPELRPDALIALNAGLGSYQGWLEIAHAAHHLNLPFAVTEYLQQSLEFVVNHQFPQVFTTPPARRHYIALNPFHCPGQRQMVSWKMPNLRNGFTMVVVGGSGLGEHY